MKLKWTKQALVGFNNIKSRHFTSIETKEYKKRLLKNIEKKVSLSGTSIPTEEGWNGSYKIVIDKFIVYYSFSNDSEICYIEYFKHSSQNR